MELHGFTYEFVPAKGDESGRTLLLLHGTGGDEHDLIPLGEALLPGAAMLSPRGRVLEHGAPRFFRRLAEGVFDLEDLKVRTAELAEFVRQAAAKHAFDATKVLAVGFSNGANIAASVLLSEPGVLAGGVLFRAMVPFEPAARGDLGGHRVYIGAGRMDPLIPAPNTERLAELLRERGAEVTLEWQVAGHGLTQRDVDGARRWLTDGAE